MHSQACPKYPKQVHSIFPIKKLLKETVKNKVDFLPAGKRQMFPQIDIIILGVCNNACPNYPK